MKLVTSAQMQQIDRLAIDHYGIPGPQLMENAGRGIAEHLLTRHLPVATGATVAIFCGKGNNGGDGFVIARYLHRAGASVSVYFLGPPDGLSPDAQLNYNRAHEAGIKTLDIRSASDLPSDLDCQLIVDAIFGTGFSGAPRDLAADMISFINRQAGIPVISVDLPSGLNADNGQHDGKVVHATATCTLALPKYGLYLSPGRELAGEIAIIDIGIPDDVIAKSPAVAELITLETVTTLLPARKPDGHKGDFGKLFVLAGSIGLTGAAALTSLSALRSGCGLVKLGCPAGTLPILATKLTEVTTHPLPDVRRKGVLALRALGETRTLIDEHDAVVIGPGIGRHHETFELIRRLVSKLEKPSIIDADGINALADHLEILRQCPSTPVITPHPGEFARLTGKSVPSDIHERMALTVATASDLKVVLLLKGSPTIIASPDGRTYLNPTGNSGMATGGSGDVLSGMIGCFLTQGINPVDAAVCGAYLHGLAGDVAADDRSERSLIAGDLLDFLPEVFRNLESRKPHP